MQQVVSWVPWTKLTRWRAKHGNQVEGPASVSVWHKPGLVNVAFHNSMGTWSTDMDFTIDESLRLAGNIITAARRAQAQVEATDEDEG